jgi:uncharacterized protein (TIGR03000 family)
MWKNTLWRNVLLSVTGAALLLAPGTSDAQRSGGSRWPGGYDPWGYHSGGNYSGPSAQSNLQYYPAESLANSKAAGFVLRLPNPDAEVWFENQKTKQQGNLREYMSGSLDPKSMYTFHIRARWMDNGRPVEQTREVEARAGQQLVVDFTTPAAPKAPATSPQN